MIVLAIIAAIFIIIAVLRIGVMVEYSVDGVLVIARVGFVRIRVFPPKVKKPKKIKNLKKVEKKKLKKAGKRKTEKKPFDIKRLLKLLQSVRTSLSRLRRKLLIKKLTIYYTAAAEDPLKTAMSYGTANAVFNSIVPMFEKNFRIKRRDLRAFADFDANATKPRIYLKTDISIAIWEIVYVAWAIVIGAVRLTKSGKEKLIDRKDVENGQATIK